VQNDVLYLLTKIGSNISDVACCLDIYGSGYTPATGTYLKPAFAGVPVFIRKQNIVYVNLNITIYYGRPA